MSNIDHPDITSIAIELAWRYPSGYITMEQIFDHLLIHFNLLVESVHEHQYFVFQGDAGKISSVISKLFQVGFMTVEEKPPGARVNPIKINMTFPKTDQGCHYDTLLYETSLAAAAAKHQAEIDKQEAEDRKADEDWMAGESK